MCTHWISEDSLTFQFYLLIKFSRLAILISMLKQESMKSSLN